MNKKTVAIGTLLAMPAMAVLCIALGIGAVQTNLNVLWVPFTVFLIITPVFGLIGSMIAMNTSRKPEVNSTALFLCSFAELIISILMAMVVGFIVYAGFMLS